VSVLVVLLAAVVALLSILVAGLLRSHSEIHRALAELAERTGPGGGAAPGPAATGRPAADLAGASPGGEPVSVAVAGVGHGTLLVFLTTTCTTCLDFWDALTRPRSRRLPRDVHLVIVTMDGAAEDAARVRELAPDDVPVVMSGAAWRDYDVTAAPSFAYVDGPTATVTARGVARGWDGVRDVVAHTVTR